MAKNNGYKLTMAEFKGAVIHHLESIDNRIGTFDGKLEKACHRITVMEVWKANVIGKLTIVAAVVSLGLTMVWDYIRTKFKA